MFNIKNNLFVIIILLISVHLLAVPQQLQISGTHTQTMSGCNFRLYGVNTSGMEYSPGGFGPPSGYGGDIKQSITAAVNTWNANCIRIPLSQDYWFGYGGANQTTYRNIVDSAISTAAGLNCYIELDLQWSGTGSWGTATGLQDMPDDNSVNFWQDVATRYANNPGVIFDLYNEPRDVSWDIWKNGGTTTTKEATTTFHTPGFQKLINTIRDTGAKNIISAGGLGYSWDLTGISANKLADTNTGNTMTGYGIMYEAHIYDNKGGSNETQKIGLWNTNVTAAVTAGFCVMIGEFGPGSGQDAGGCTPFETDLLSWINGNNTANYTYNAMAWNFSTEAGPCLLSSWSGFTPTACHGTQVKNWLAAITPSNCAPASTPAYSPSSTGTFTPARTATFTPSRTTTSTPVITATFTPSRTPTFINTVTTTAVFANGADVGWLSQMEASGKKFYNSAGVQLVCLQILMDLCINSIRLRVWVNPANGYCGKADVVAMAVRAHNMGFRIMIDFHYSDTWADPANQTKPAAWAADTFPQLVQDVYNHTYDVLSTLAANGVTPEWVQVGNETNNGMLWDTNAAISGRATDSMSNYAQLEASGYNAVKAVNSSIKVIVHISNGYDNGLFEWIFDGLKNNGGKWDIMGMSLYPDAADPYTTYDPECLTNMNDMVSRYPGKQVMISEFGYDVTQPQTAHDFGVDLINKVKSVPNNNGLGVFYWEPECYNGWQGYGKGAFDNTGKPTLAMNAFAENCVAPVMTGTITPSPVNTVTNTCTGTKTQTITITQTRTATPSITATLTAVMTSTGTTTPTPVETQTSSVLPSVTQTCTSAVMPVQTQTITVYPSATQTLTSAAVETQTTTEVPNATQTSTSEPEQTQTSTAYPSVTQTCTLTAIPSQTQTSTAYPSVTQTCTLTAIPSQTQTSTTYPSVTQTCTLTAIPSKTLTSTEVPAATATVTTTPSLSATENITPSFTPAGTPTGTFTPAATAGTFVITDAVNYPNPYNMKSPLYIRFNTNRVSSDTVLMLYTESFRRILKFNEGAFIKGSAVMQVPAEYLKEFSNGTYYYFIEAKSEGKKGRSSIGKIIILR